MSFRPRILWLSHERRIAAGALAILGASALASPAGSQTASPLVTPTYPLPAPVYYSGTVNATITITYGVAPAAGSIANCSLSLISSDARSPSDTQTTSAPISGATATCVMTLRYRWRLTTPSTDTMTFAYTVQGPTQSSTGLVNIIPMPADGYVASLVFTVNQ